MDDLERPTIRDERGASGDCSMSCRTSLLFVICRARKFIAIVNEGNRYEGLARIGHINRAVNFAIRGTNKAVPEEWTSPLATLERGDGDCKQYAVLKYAALIDAGYAPDVLRIVIVGDKSLHVQHAMVAVRNEGRWLFLNNRSLMLGKQRSHKPLRPAKYT